MKYYRDKSNYTVYSASRCSSGSAIIKEQKSLALHASTIFPPKCQKPGITVNSTKTQKETRSWYQTGGPHGKYHSDWLNCLFFVLWQLISKNSQPTMMFRRSKGHLLEVLWHGMGRPRPIEGAHSQACNRQSADDETLVWPLAPS